MTDTRKYQTPEELITLADELLDLSTTRHHDYTSGESFRECRICGEWDSHSDTCFVPKLRDWFEGV